MIAPRRNCCNAQPGGPAATWDIPFEACRASASTCRITWNPTPRYIHEAGPVSILTTRWVEPMAIDCPGVFLSRGLGSNKQFRGWRLRQTRRHSRCSQNIGSIFHSRWRSFWQRGVQEHGFPGAQQNKGRGRIQPEVQGPALASGIFRRCMSTTDWRSFATASAADPRIAEPAGAGLSGPQVEPWACGGRRLDEFITSHAQVTLFTRPARTDGRQTWRWSIAGSWSMAGRTAVVS